MNYGRIEQITLKGADTDGGEYVTDTILSGYSSYKEFEGLYIAKQPVPFSDSETTTYPNGYTSSARDYAMQIDLESRWEGYPSSSFDIRSYLIDNSGNLLTDVLKCKYHWIQNTGSYFYELVPTTEVNYATKNLSVGIKSQFEQTSSMVRCLITAYTGLI